MPSRVMRRLAACTTSLSSERAGQASVEAALFLPVLMLLLALLLQPAFALYTRCVMEQAASEGLRAVATSGASAASSQDACAAYVRRRLRAVPDVPAFHVGGEDGWQIECVGSSSMGQASVRVAGRLRPLPLVGLLGTVFGEVKDGEVVLRVEVSENTRPDWLGGDYGGWISIWG